MVDDEDELCYSRVGTWHAVVYRCLEGAARADRSGASDAPACDEEEERVDGRKGKSEFVGCGCEETEVHAGKKKTVIRSTRATCRLLPSSATLSWQVRVRGSARPPRTLGVTSDLDAFPRGLALDSWKAAWY